MAELRRGEVTPIVALDVPTLERAIRIVDELGDLCRFYKIGSELFTAAGSDAIARILDRGASVFLDLKLHDIPTTVKGAARSASALGVRLLTVHASGGRAMLEAAVTGAKEGGDCGILGVTILTSLDTGSLSAAWGRTIEDIEVEVIRLAETAAAAGLHGVVCSGQEALAVSRRFGSRLAVLVPGVRLPGGTRQDQARVVTPRAAAAAGARYIVLGRAVTAAPSLRHAMETVLSDLS